MSDVDLVGLARRIATRAHSGHLDKGGQAYIGHPARVAASVAAHGEAATIVAWLHDTVEDTSVTLAGLRNHFSDVVVDAVDAITRRQGEGASSYYARVRGNALASIVKLADIADNMDEDRLAVLPPDVADRLRRKYAQALRELGGTSG